MSLQTYIECKFEHQLSKDKCWNVKCLTSNDKRQTSNVAGLLQNEQKNNCKCQRWLVKSEKLISEIENANFRQWSRSVENVETRCKTSDEVKSCNEDLKQKNHRKWVLQQKKRNLINININITLIVINRRVWENSKWKLVRRNCN